MAEQTPSNEPVKYVLDFEVFLQNQFNAAAGMRSTLKKLDDGQYIVEYETDPDASPLCNADGGKHIVNNMRMIMNRHAAFGNLERDEIADMCGNIIKATIIPMGVWRTRYGVRSLSDLGNYGLNLFEGTYAYMTSIKAVNAGGSGGLKDFGEKISTVQYVAKQENPEAKKGLY